MMVNRDARSLKSYINSKNKNKKIKKTETKKEPKYRR
jgi:hypothetical protein